MSPTMFVLPIPSEIANVLNFLFLDILMLSYLMYMSGLLAGHANHFTLRNQCRLDLVPCDIPLVGGGIVMPRGRQRQLLLALRLSAVLAVFACNFGLEGRSRTHSSTRSAFVREPGPLTDPDCDIVCAAERRRYCLRMPESNGRDSPLMFGAVIDDQCYPELTDHVYIKALEFHATELTASATNCKSEPDCDRLHTKFRCDNADLSCHGLLNNSGCPPLEGDELPSFSPETCVAIVYASDMNSGWICFRGELEPELQEKSMTCRGFEAGREDLKWWLDHINNDTSDPELAIFASAYGVEKKLLVDVPDGEKAITVVNLFWLLPVAWVVSAVVVITIWRRVLVLKKAPVLVHDEGGLAKLLDRRIERQIAWESGELNRENRSDSTICDV